MTLTITLKRIAWVLFTLSAANATFIATTSGDGLMVALNVVYAVFFAAILLLEYDLVEIEL